ncbi:RNA polymerase sigma factor for flagellar operon FliA [Kineococcus radiotolerans]|uniref:RNA polymerase sigma factor for flagellar operon FliA n=1 Tax=Kineococcus radiotolerans TaxID=131568 RepID=A0A7W4TIT1_KINRA|nr:sigma-70 family RNA polymerase sigma factor [Kineococcus radiotolerans]MBB2899680.1 RNA polymerase sigma factor for flagellar operon FliA [Kineococcus radiotolerans]
MTADTAFAARELPMVELSAAERHALVEKNLPLVGYITSEFIGRLPSHVSRDDLTSAGLMALFQASRGYDPNTGVPFNRYANTRIRGAILDDLRGADWASRGVRSRQRQLSRTEDQLTTELGRTPTSAELAASLGVSEKELASTRDEAQRSMVLSMQGFTAEGGSLDDHLPTHAPGPEQELLHRERLGYLRSAIAVLPERLKHVIEGYFIQERPMAELAEELEVSESRISQMRAEALALLRDGMNTHLSPEMVSKVTGSGAAVKRKESYFAAVGAQSDFRSRLALSAFASVGVQPARRTA